MEEKERYELLNDSFIYDNKLKEYVGSPSASMKHYTETLTDLLNQQDKRIKGLEEINKKLDKLAFKDFNAYMRCSEKCTQLVKENQQLKQLQKRLAIEELVKLLNSFAFYENEDGNTFVSTKCVLSIFDYIGIRINELVGGKNE